MPGPSERIVLDAALLGTLVERLRALRDLLWHHARVLTALLRPLGWPGDPASALRQGADWADGSARALARRRVLAQAVQEARTTALADGGRIALTLPPDPFRGDGEAARAAGATLGAELAAAALRLSPDTATITDVAARLRAGAHDPDLVAGFVESLGPDRLAAILRLAEGLRGGGYIIEATARGPRVRAGRGGPRSTAGLPGRRLPVEVAGALTSALAAALSTFSGTGRLTVGWLARFNARGETGAAETTLLGPLIRQARFAPATLRPLGDALFSGTDVDGRRYRLHAASLGPDTTGVDVRDVGLFGGEPASARADYAAALLRAIADEPTIAARFAADHVEKVLAGSRMANLPPPLHPGVPEQVAGAWAYLVGRAGGPLSRQADPVGAVGFVARLGFAVHQYQAAQLDQARHRDSSWPLPADLRVAVGQVLSTWRDEMYSSATSLLPAADALRDASGNGLVTAWPASATTGQSAGGPWSTRLAGPADGARIPARLWADLLGEALAAGGPVARTLATDAAVVAQRWDQAQWVATRGYRGDGRIAYPASPRALGYLRESALAAFFLAALAGAADRLALRAELAAQDEAVATVKVIDELAAIARAFKPDDPIGTLWGIAVGVPVAAIVDDLKPSGPSGPSVPSSDALATIESARAATATLSGWQAAYLTSATAVWLRRADDPIIPVDVTDALGVRRRFTGDPRLDGFITGPLDDFLDPADHPLPPERMSHTQRDAYLRWVASPALVANNDHIPVLAHPAVDIDAATARASG